MTTKRIVLTLAALMFAGAAPAAAMQVGDIALAMAPEPTNAEKADELQRQAESLFSEKKQWRKAVRLLEQSAELRDASDPAGYTCLMYAGRIKWALGDAAGARASMQKAAEQALARGSVMEAASAYIDAAHAAVEDGQQTLARQYVEKASLLAESPLLTAGQRETLKARVDVD